MAPEHCTPQPNGGCSPSVSFITLGCAKNEVDTSAMQRRVAEAGYALTDDLESAAVVVVNTCSFIQAATEESIDTILEVCGLNGFANGDMKLVVAGCMPARYGDDLAAELPEAAAFVPCSREDDIADVLDGIFKDSAPRAASSFATGSNRVGVEIPSPGYPAAYVKISDGCDRFCSFCMIPFIRGGYHSFTLEDICSDVQSRVAEGAREITLIAQDTGRWGEDFEEPSTTAVLLDELAVRFPDIWFRIMYVEPEGVTDDLLKVMARHSNICNYLDMPVQHSSARILRAMNRKGSGGEFLQLVRHIRDMVPGITLRTTLIAGFPGETDVDFEQLEDFLEEAAFDYVGVFAFSPEEGTRAAALPDQIDDETKLSRAQELRDLCDSISSQVVSDRIGTCMDVLVLGAEEDGQLFGRAACQAPEVDGVVYLESGQIGSFVPVEIVDTLAYEMEGELIGC